MMTPWGRRAPARPPLPPTRGRRAPAWGRRAPARRLAPVWITLLCAALLTACRQPIPAVPISLADAVAAAAPGTRIVLEAGVYPLSASLTIDRPITLVGAGVDQTTIAGVQPGYVVRFTGAGPFVVEGISFAYQGAGPADVVVVQGGEVTFRDCRFAGAALAEGGGTRAGLRLQGDARATVQGCVAEGNENTGILVEGRAQATLEENVCRENTGAGIAFVSVAGGAARRNECTVNGLGGILVAGEADPLLEANVCNGNGDAGIVYFEGGGGAARGNECVGNARHGIFVIDTARVVLTGNDCRENGLYDVRDTRP